jgi:hypothetical protein
VRSAATDEEFRKYFDRKPFLFSHSLSGHELLSLSAIRDLAVKLSTNSRPRGYLNLGGRPAELKWGTSTFVESLQSAFDNMGASRLRLKLSKIHSETQYRELLDECTRELKTVVGEVLSEQYRDPVATLFITSPDEITPYHVDGEANFLFQIAGEKRVFVVDGRDCEQVSEADLERYWGTYNMELNDVARERAFCFDLKPGQGVHIPVSFPHWVENSSAPSISLSVNFARRADVKDVLWVNYQMRKLGIQPAPCGHNRKLDYVKHLIAGTARRVKRIL